MKSNFDLQRLIKDIINRPSSLLSKDLENNREKLSEIITNSNIMVIGGAGTIGSSFIKAILRQGKPAKLFVVDINENNLTELVRDIRSSNDLHIPSEILTYPINFGDRVFLKILEQEGPFSIVANFAAHKHVRSEKDAYAIEAMIDNNVIKAKGLLDQLLKHPPDHFFCVSTDKAANPVNIMGASKKLMEEVIMAYTGKIKISTARFANVAFSNGSLPFGFQERLAKKQPLSAPGDVKRFFVSPDESGEICMLACLLGKSGDIFYPKLVAEKNMESFTTIAEKFLAAHGYTPEYCSSEAEAREKALLLHEGSSRYPVYFFNSDTSGEKPYEEFYTDEEELDTSSFEQLGVIKNTPRKEMAEIEELFKGLKALFVNDFVDKKDIVSYLSSNITNFNHIEKGKSLDQRM